MGKLKIYSSSVLALTILSSLIVFFSYSYGKKSTSELSKKQSEFTDVDEKISNTKFSSLKKEKVKSEINKEKKKNVYNSRKEAEEETKVSKENETRPVYRPGEIVVKFKSPVLLAGNRVFGVNKIYQFNKTIKNYNVKDIKKINSKSVLVSLDTESDDYKKERKCLSLTQNNEGLSEVDTSVSEKNHQNCEKQIKTSMTTSQLLDEMKSLGIVEYAEYNYYNYIRDDTIPQMWNIENTGQEYPTVEILYNEEENYWYYSQTMVTGTAGSDVNVKPAWQEGKMGDEIVVAVVDSGVDVTHPDIQQNIWTNQDEIPDNDIDDDGNGYVDDVNGYDMVSYEECEEWGYAYSNDCENKDGGRDNNVSDYDGHGTHVSGTIAARLQDPNEGVAGIAPNAQIMPVRGLGVMGGVSQDLADGIIYAVDNGATVINCSWGPSIPGPGSEIVSDAVEYAFENDVVVVFAAGNSNSNNILGYYSGTQRSADNVVFVSASDSNDERAAFSNYGTDTDIYAPGVDILSLLSGDAGYNSVFLYEGSLIKSGTSMSTPQVAGAVALLQQDFAQNNGGEMMSFDFVKSALKTGAKDLGESGFDEVYADGGLDIYASLNEEEYIYGVIESPTPSFQTNGIVEIEARFGGNDFSNWKLYFSDDEVNWNLLDSGVSHVENYVYTLDLTTHSDGTYYLKLEANGTTVSDVSKTSFIKASLSHLDWDFKDQFSQSGSVYSNHPWKIEKFSTGEFVIKDYNYLYKTDQNKQSWELLDTFPAPDFGGDCDIFIDDNDTLFVSANEVDSIYRGCTALYKSDDFGSSWNKLLSIEDLIGNAYSADTLITIDSIHVDGEKIYFSASFSSDGINGSEFVRTSKIVKSNDYGLTWIVIADELEGHDPINDSFSKAFLNYDIERVNGRTIVLANSGVCVPNCPPYISTYIFYSDNDVDWQQASVQHEYNGNDIYLLMGYEIYPANDGTLYWSTLGYVYRSFDNGSTWEIVSKVPGVGLVYDIEEFDYNGESYMVMGHYGVGAEGYYSTVHYSPDDGENWYALGKDMFRTPFGFVEENGKLYAAVDGQYLVVLSETVEDNFLPEFEYIEQSRINAGESVEIQLDVFDPDGDDLDITASGLPDGAVLNDTVFTWTAPLDYWGKETILFKATDGKNDTYQAAKILVNSYPVIDDMENIEVNIGETVQFTISASDPDPNDQITKMWFSGLLPDGASFDRETGEFVWDTSVSGIEYTSEEYVQFGVEDIMGYESYAGLKITINTPDKNMFVKGNVFEDLNLNKDYDFDIESGLEGYGIKLSISNDGSWSYVDMVSATGLEGDYKLFLPGKGEYKVEVLGGSSSYNPTTPEQYTFTADTYGVDYEYDFGFVSNESNMYLKGVVFEDLNLNGTFEQTDEAGLDNFDIKTSIKIDEAWYELTSQLTSTDGYYEVYLSEIGEYKVEVVSNNGYNATTETEYVFTADSYNTDYEFDFGYVSDDTEMYVLGNVFEDLNKSGNFDSDSESGLEGYEIDLYQKIEEEWSLLDTFSNTGSDGSYEMYLPSVGEYKVKVDNGDESYVPTTKTYYQFNADTYRTVYRFDFGYVLRSSVVDVKVDIEDTKDPVSVGNMYSYKVKVTNIGGKDSVFVRLSMKFGGDGNVKLLGIMSDKGTCYKNGGATISTGPYCEIYDLEAGGTANITLLMKARGSGTKYLKGIAYSQTKDYYLRNSRNKEYTEIK